MIFPSTVIAHLAAQEWARMRVPDRLENRTQPTQPKELNVMFSAEDFLTSSNESVLDTKFNLLPEMECKATIPLDDKALVISSGEKDGKPWAQIAVKLEIQDPLGNIEKELGRKPQVTDRFFLDLDDNGKLDMKPQRNIRLGQYLAATGNAKQGWKLTDLKGKTLKCKVIQVKSDMNPGEKRNAVTQLGVA